MKQAVAGQQEQAVIQLETAVGTYHQDIEAAYTSKFNCGGKGPPQCAYANPSVSVLAHDAQALEADGANVSDPATTANLSQFYVDSQLALADGKTLTGTTSYNDFEDDYHKLVERCGQIVQGSSELSPAREILEDLRQSSSLRRCTFLRAAVAATMLTLMTTVVLTVLALTVDTNLANRMAEAVAGSPRLRCSWPSLLDAVIVAAGASSPARTSAFGNPLPGVLCFVVTDDAVRTVSRSAGDLADRCHFCCGHALQSPGC